MAKLALYRVVNRELEFQRWVDVPDSVTFFDGWLRDNGFDRTYTLRRGLVRDFTQADIRRELGPIKPQPSAASLILGKLTRKGR
jgi:hypothetical protein